MSLVREDFAAIFHTVYGQRPFAWQERLLDEVIRGRRPDTIVAPTGTGKTAVIDIALFHLALETASGAAPGVERRAPRRIVFAVDRRVVVDQAFAHSCALRSALEQATSGPLAAMAAVLRTHGGAGPVHVGQLRGGMPREDDWALTPVQPTILCTTVDQLGSRLLFRGYGVSPGMAPIHAGLLGEDALILLDEAHLANPFRETLAAMARRRSGTESPALPWAFSTLTATPREAGGATFCLTDAERDEPEIARRLSARKSAELRSFKASADGAEYASAIVAAAQAIAAGCARPDPTIAVIVNRVSRARAVFDGLCTPERGAILLTGRVRPVERDALIESYQERLLAGGRETETRARGVESAGPLFVVATQCVEAGCDFDFDAMLTEAAPLDALVQRFGRLNRLGRKPAAPAIIFSAQEQVSRSAKDDPIYADRVKLTWEWLLAHAKPSASGGLPALEVSPRALGALIAEDPGAAAACASEVRSAPILRTADVGFFATTNPAPYPDTYLPLYLHGAVNVSPEVAVVWRADCEMISRDPGDPEQTGGEKAADEAHGIEVLTLMPPRPGEALSVPIWAARDWLSAAPGEPTHADRFGDAAFEAPPGEEARTPRGRRVLRWRGADNSETRLVGPRELGPGDLIVVPASYGGCDRFGWAPTSDAAVADIGDLAARPYARRYFALRLHAALWRQETNASTEASAPEWRKFWPEAAAAAEGGGHSLLRALGEMPDLPPGIRNKLPLPGAARFCLEYPYRPDEEGRPSGLVLIALHGLRNGGVGVIRRAGIPATEDDRTGSFAAGPVSIREHAAAVEGQVLAFADAVGLGRTSATLVATLAFAARHHDDGKADPRFQAWLAGPEGPSPDEPLAKSGRWRGAFAEHKVREAAGLPAHWRHEALSVRLAARRLAVAVLDEIDSDLALYLIGTHHGQGRPFFQHHDPWDAEEQSVLGLVLPPGAGPERLDFDWRGMDWVE
ncbi:MAG: type I-G CRISPR-associated helicase/endonuclease Cas3g, partial [Acetobacteraceae bacterium]